MLYINAFLFSFRSLEPGQANFQAFSIAGCSFPTRSDESGAVLSAKGPYVGEPERDPFADLDSPPFDSKLFHTNQFAGNGLLKNVEAKNDSFGEATFLDFEKICADSEAKQSTLDEIEREVNKVCVALDEDSRILDEDESNQAEADNWSLNVSCDSGVYNRASSRDSGPHSG